MTVNLFRSVIIFSNKTPDDPAAGTEALQRELQQMSGKQSNNGCSSSAVFTEGASNHWLMPPHCSAGAGNCCSIIKTEFSWSEHF